GGKARREACMLVHGLTSIRKHDAAGLTAALQPADDLCTHAGKETIPTGRVVDNIGAIKRRTENGGLGALSAIAAADTIIVDRRHRIVLQRIVRVLDRQRRTAGESDAGVIAGADVLVDAEALLDHPLAVLHRLGELRLYAALLVQHAFRG